MSDDVWCFFVIAEPAKKDEKNLAALIVALQCEKLIVFFLFLFFVVSQLFLITLMANILFLIKLFSQKSIHILHLEI